MGSMWPLKQHGTCGTCTMVVLRQCNTSPHSSEVKISSPPLSFLGSYIHPVVICSMAASQQSSYGVIEASKERLPLPSPTH